MPSVTAEPPIWLPREPPVTEMPVPTEMLEVATLVTPAPPDEYRRLPAVIAVVVARPVQLIVELEPPTRAPNVPPTENGPETARDVVATLERAFVSLP